MGQVLRFESNLIIRLGLIAVLSSLIACTGEFKTAKGVFSGTNGLGTSSDTDATKLAITGPDEMSASSDLIQLRGECIPGRSVNIMGSGLQAPVDFVCESGAFEKTVKLSAGEGTKNIILTQNLGHDLVSTVSRSFVKDSTSPLVQVISPAVGDAFKSSFAMSGSCETGLLVQVYGPGVIADTSTKCENGTFQIQVELSNPDGAKNVFVAQTDRAGNVGSLGRALVRDTVAPMVSLISPAANSSANSGVTLSGSCESGLMVDVSGTGLASPVSVACTNSMFSTNIVFSTGDGAKAVTVSQTDKAGNQSTLVSRSFNRISAGPVITIAMPAANSVHQSEITLSGSCVTGLSVQISGTGVSGPSMASCVNSAFSSRVVLSAGDGSKNVIVSQRDAANNLGQDSRSFVKDSVGPSIMVASPMSGTATKGSITLSGSCESGLPITFAGSGVSATSMVNCQNRMFSAPLTLSANDGAKAIEISQVDGAGNRTNISFSVTKDTVAPVVQIIEPAAGTVAATGLKIKGSCETGLPVEVSGSGLASPASQVCATNAFSIDVLFSANDGKKLVSVSQTDRAGNVAKVDREFVRGPAPSALDGAVLYAQNCQVCHGMLATSTKRGRSASQISTAIAGIPSMAALASLSSAQVSAIASALAAPSQPMACSPDSVRKAALRRLNSREFANSIRDALGVTVNEILLPRNDLNGSGYDTDGSALRLSDLDAQKYLEVLQAATNTLYSSPVKAGFDFTCPNTATEMSSRTCTSSKLSLLASRALKKTLSAAELARYVTFAKTETDVTEGLKTAMVAMLIGPHFLYLNGSPAPAQPGAAVQAIGDLELAHRLSLMLWSSIPDDTLMSHVASGKIKESATLRAQVARMVADPKFKTGFGQGFVDHWLELYKLNGITRGDASVPGFSEAHLKDMAEESRLFVQYLVVNNRPMSEILVGQYSFLNQRMAQIYGVSGNFTATSFQMTQLPANQRSGLITHPSISTLTGKSDSTSPVKRGHWMTKRILCSEPPPPPPDIPVFDSGNSSGLTVKERLAAHRTNATCAGCHAQMDPVGIGLENLSQVGKWRTSYGSMPVDATESLDSIFFNGPVELGKILAPREDVKACITSQVATYALGRATSTDDACYVKEIITKTEAASTKGMLTLLQEMVDSPMFKQHKVGE